MIIGNEQAIILTKRAIQSNLSPILLYGPKGIGKRSFLHHFISDDDLRSLHKLPGDSGIDCFREMLSELALPGHLGKAHLVVSDFEEASEASKDLMLKFLEDSPSHINQIYTTASPELLGDPILSRFRVKIRWYPLSKKDMLSINNDDFSVRISMGSYSLFNSSFGDKKLHELYEVLVHPDWPKMAVSTKIPDVLNLKNVNEIRRQVIANVFWYASRKSRYRLSFLKLASMMSNQVAINIPFLYHAEAASHIIV